MATSPLPPRGLKAIGDEGCREALDEAVSCVLAANAFVL